MQATVLQMLRIGTARDAILDMLVNLHDNEWLGEREAKDLKQYVLACTDALQDSSSMFPTPNQRIIQSRELFASTKRSKEQLQQIVDTSTAKMEMVSESCNTDRQPMVHADTTLATCGGTKNRAASRPARCEPLLAPPQLEAPLRPAR